jgi:hypothetical protein
MLSTACTCLQIKIGLHTSDWSDMIGNFRDLPNHPENITSLNVKVVDWPTQFYHFIRLFFFGQSSFEFRSGVLNFEVGS